MECLPKSISSLLSIEKYHKSCCTIDRINLVETLVLECCNFLKISEIVANLGLSEFPKKKMNLFFSYLSSIQTSALQKQTDEECITFYEDVLFFFPSDPQLIRIYLDRFKEMKLFY